MFRKIIKLFFIFVILFWSKTYSDFVICDSWNINYSWKTISEICNWWYENFDISVIEYFTWSYINLNSWFWWGEQNFDFKKNENIPIWFFDQNKKTIIENINPIYDFSAWYMGTSHSFSWIFFDVENNNPIWFFDLNKKTIILKTGINYSFPAWYLWNVIINKKNWWIKWWSRSPDILIENISYKEFFHDIFKGNINSEFLNKYSSYELDLFINDLLDLFSESDKNLEKIISEDSKNRIKLHIKNSNFNEKFNKLIKNLDLVNDAFKNTNNETQKFYIVKYFLD
jgi:hypothetical protein